MRERGSSGGGGGGGGDDLSVCGSWVYLEGQIVTQGTIYISSASAVNWGSRNILKEREGQRKGREGKVRVAASDKDLLFRDCV